MNGQKKAIILLQFLHIFREKAKAGLYFWHFYFRCKKTILSAKSVHDSIVATLSIFKKSLENVIFNCGDNCNVNLKLNSDTNIPLIGCSSHRLNLAIQKYLQKYSLLLNKIDQLMEKLSTIKSVA